MMTTRVTFHLCLHEMVITVMIHTSVACWCTSRLRVAWRSVQPYPLTAVTLSPATPVPAASALVVAAVLTHPEYLL